MSKLRIALPEEKKPVKLRLDIPADLHVDLKLYAELLARDSGQNHITIEKIIVPMLIDFLQGDKGFQNEKKQNPNYSIRN
ncbi:DUF2274 domain-containing protein [Bartonella sp. LJL80]